MWTFECVCRLRFVYILTNIIKFTFLQILVFLSCLSCAVRLHKHSISARSGKRVFFRICEIVCRPIAVVIAWIVICWFLSLIQDRQAKPKIMINRKSERKMKKRARKFTNRVSHIDNKNEKIKTKDVKTPDAVAMSLAKPSALFLEMFCNLYVRVHYINIRVQQACIVYILVSLANHKSTENQKKKNHQKKILRHCNGDAAWLAVRRTRSRSPKSNDPTEPKNHKHKH